MKEIKIPNTTYITKYQSADGSIFDTLEECNLFEHSAAGVVLNKLSSCIINGDARQDWFDTDECHIYKLLIPKTQEDIDNLRILGSIVDNNALVNISEDVIDTLLLLGYNYECNRVYYAWIINLKKELESLLPSIKIQYD